MSFSFFMPVGFAGILRQSLLSFPAIKSRFLILFVSSNMSFQDKVPNLFVEMFHSGFIYIMGLTLFPRIFLIQKIQCRLWSHGAVESSDTPCDYPLNLSDHWQFQRFRDQRGPPAESI